MEFQLNKLEDIFHKQKQLQERINEKKISELVGDQKFINMMSIALIDEIMEALRETPFKSWKKQQKFNQEAFKEELVDAWHFLVNLSLASGMDAEELHERFCNKNKVNHKRQNDNY